MLFKNVRRYFTSLKNVKSSLKNYALILFIPLFLALALLIAVWQITNQQLESTGNTTVRHFITEISGNMNEVEKVAGFIESDESIRQYLTSDIDSSEAREAICRQILHYIDSTELINSAYIFSKNQNRVYCSAFPCTYSYGASARSILSYYGLIDAGEVLPDDFRLQDGWHKASGAVLSPCYVLNLDSDDGDMLVITLSTSVLTNYLFIIDANFCCLYSDGCSISTRVSSSEWVDWNSDDSVSRYLGTDVRCFREEGEIYSYLIAIPTDTYNQPIKLLFSLFGLYFLLVLLILGSHIIRLAQKRYDKVSGLLDLIPAASHHTTEDEIFKAIRSSLTEFKYNSENAEQRRRADNILSCLLAESAYEMAHDSEKDTGIPTYCAAMFVVNFSVLDYSALSQVHPEDKAEVEGIFRIIIKEALEYLSGGHFRVFLSSNILDFYPVVLSLSKWELNSEQLVKNAVENAISAIIRDYGIFMFASISDPVRSIDDLHIAYQQAETLSRLNSTMDEPGSVITANTISTDSSNPVGEAFLKQYRILVNLMSSDKYDIIPGTVDAIIDEHIEPLQDHPTRLLMRISLISALLSECPQLDLSHYGKELRKQLKANNSISQLRRLTSEICALPYDETVSKDSVELCLRYMEENYSNSNLCLNDICAAVNANVQTLSRQFKAKKNTTIMQYLNTLRVRKAAELLPDRNYSLNDISEAVGYFSPETFVRNFRKVEGVTPNEYRKLCTATGKQT